ncbi:MAG: hypothetical protein KDA42_18800, partial [Planctomycetales bacterium]|nr:hypothetical protein [Planctomycetales bacterium]
MRLLSCAAVLILTISSVAVGQADETATEATSIPQEFHDAEFDKFLDLAQLRAAWSDMDHVALAHIADQLAAGERQVGRAHKIASSKTLLMRAARAAAQRGDAESLAEIAEIAKKREWIDILSLVEAAQKTIGES